MLKTSFPSLSQIRSKSPSSSNASNIRDVGDMINESNPIYIAAMQKLYDAAWKFDRGKNGDLLETLNNRELEKMQFRTIMRMGMNCKFTEQELESLMPLMDNNGFVDGTEFTLLFYRLRFDYRSKLLTDRVMREKKDRESLVYRAKKKIEDKEEKMQLQLAESFSDEDLSSAMNKLMEASVKYDRLMPGAVQLDAFECEYMTPTIFREQLKMVFNTQLTIPELTAFLRQFNKDNTVVEGVPSDSINCAAFLVSFLRMGFKERDKRLREFWEKKHNFEVERDRKKLEKLQAQENKNLLKSNLKFTPKEKESAVAKLKISAKKYDKAMPGAMSMLAFEIKSMPPHIFREQLKRVFNLPTTQAELGALMSIFDANGDGFIVCEEFTKVFLNMGIVERDRELKEQTARQKRADENRLRKIKQKEDELAGKNSLKVSYSYSEAEFNSAMHALTEAAWRYDKNASGAPCLEAFELKFMEPHVLQEQLKRSFYMKITAPELGAIMHYFDPEGKGYINCEHFMKVFSKLGIDERSKKKESWAKHQKELNIQREIKAVAKKKADDDKMALKGVSHEYSEDDFTSAFALLTEGAIRYFKTGPGSVPLNAFEVATLQPHVFREQLKMVFNVKVTLPQLWALVAHFDKTNTGAINCEQFLVQFFRTGYEERNRIKRHWRGEEKKAKEDVKAKREAKIEEDSRIAWKEVDFNFGEEEFDSALTILVQMCYSFDQRQLGPAGLSAFESATLNPAEFREMLKRTFNVKVSSRELGALVTYFDTTMPAKRVVNCTMFLNSLVQVRGACNELKGKKGEAGKLAEYQKGLKTAYRSRMKKQPGTDSRPWRTSTVLSPPKAKSGTAFKLAHAPPASALEKYKMRIQAAEQTNVLDLTSHRADGNVNLMISGYDVVDIDGNIFIRKQRGTEGVDDGGDEVSELGLLSSSSSVVNVEVVKQKSKKVRNNKISEPEGEEDDDLRSIGSQIGTQAEHTLSKNQQLLKEKAEKEEQVRRNAVLIKSQQAPVEGDTVDFKIDFVPPEVFQMTDLTSLWLCNNRIPSVPSQIGELKRLQVLSLANNKLSAIPPEICLLERLRVIHAQGNSMNSLPNLFGRLRLLTELDISDNQFQDFPIVLSTLPRLTTLDMSKNKLTVLPKALKSLKTLIILHVKDNLINEAPDVLMQMPWLQISGCPIPAGDTSSLPFHISGLEQEELQTLLQMRSQSAVTNKLRRRKKKSAYVTTMGN